MLLRNYQLLAFQLMLKRLEEGCTRLFVSLPTGTGKRVILVTVSGRTSQTLREHIYNEWHAEVIIEKVSTHWIRIQVLRLHVDWGREELYHLRLHGKHTDWTAEEDALIREHYATITVII